VMRVGYEPRHDIERALAAIGAQDGREVSRDSKVGDGRRIEDVFYAHESGARTHVRTMVGTRPEALVGICHGKEADFAVCEKKLDLINVQVDKFDTGPIKDILMWVVIALLAIGAAGSVVIAVLRKRRLARSAKLTEGEHVTVSGTVKSVGTVLEAPLSGRRCVSHQSRARVVLHDRLVGEPSETETVPFVVETKHGSVQVEGELVHRELAETVVDTGSDRLRSFLDKHAAPKQASASYSEVVVEPGAKVTIKGIVALERDHASTDERGYRDDAPTTIKLVGTTAKPITVLKIW